MKEEEETQGHGLKAVCLQRQRVYKQSCRLMQALFRFQGQGTLEAEGIQCLCLSWKQRHTPVAKMTHRSNVFEYVSMYIYVCKNSSLSQAEKVTKFECQ